MLIKDQTRDVPGRFLLWRSLFLFDRLNQYPRKPLLIVWSPSVFSDPGIPFYCHNQITSDLVTFKIPFQTRSFSLCMISINMSYRLKNQTTTLNVQKTIYYGYQTKCLLFNTITIIRSCTISTRQNTYFHIVILYISA